MPIIIRDVRESELDAVLTLNNEAGLAILPLDLSALYRFYKEADYFRVAERDGNLAGFWSALVAQVAMAVVILRGSESGTRTFSISTVSSSRVVVVGVASDEHFMPTYTATPSCATPI